MNRASWLASTAAVLGTVPLRAGAQTTPLRIASTTGDSYAEGIYADAMGFFKQAGLDVDLTILANGATIVQAVAGGALDIGISNILPIALAVEHGLPFTYICSGGLYNPKETSLCVLADGPIKTARDLEGKTVAASSLRDIAALSVLAWVDQQGGDSHKIRIVEVPFREMEQALQRGLVAAAPIAEPVLSTVLKTGTVRVLLPPYHDVFGRNFITGGWFTTKDWVAKNRPLARRFVQTIYATGKWANTHLDETATILAKVAKLDPAVVRTMNRSPFGSELTQSMIQPVLDIAYRYKFIDRPLAATDIITTP